MVLVAKPWFFSSDAKVRISWFKCLWIGDCVESKIVNNNISPKLVPQKKFHLTSFFNISLKLTNLALGFPGFWSSHMRK
jgi:hypothetical protein